METHHHPRYVVEDLGAPGTFEERYSTTASSAVHA